VPLQQLHRRSVALSPPCKCVAWYSHLGKVDQLPKLVSGLGSLTRQPRVLHHSRTQMLRVQPTKRGVKGARLTSPGEPRQPGLPAAAAYDSETAPVAGAKAPITAPGYTCSISNLCQTRSQAHSQPATMQCLSSSRASCSMQRMAGA